MGKWQEFSLGNLIHVKHGFAFKGEFFQTEPNNIILATPGNFKIGGGWKEDKCKYYNSDIPEDYILKGGELVVTMTDLSKEVDTLGYSAIIPKKTKKTYLHNQRIGLVEFFNDKIDKIYLYWLMRDKEYRWHVVSSASGSTVSHTSPTRIKEYEFLLPPLPEQKAIASVLSSLDDKIDLLHRQNKTLEAMAETLFRQWFVGEEQEDWEEKTLGELLDITSSKRIFYKEYVSFGVPFYRSKEIIELHNTGVTNGELYIAENRFDEIVEKFGAPVEGDILLTSVGTLGIPYRVKKNDRFYFKDGNLTWFKNFKGIPSIIIYFWLKSNIGKEQLDAITIGSTQSALTISGLKEIGLLIPPTDKLKEIESYLLYIYNKIDSNHSQIRTLEKLRDTLLPELMSGEVRVDL